MLNNEPLLFVQGPPVYIKVVKRQEESTSVFILSGEEPEMVSADEEVEIEIEQEQPAAVKVAEPSLVRKIMYLGTPFSRQVYRPLQFVLEDETLTGSIEKIEGETVLIGVGEDASELVSVEMAKIEEILWRGDPFVED